ncbi:phage holin family protein [Thalassospira povalilytica]|uniref:phage holin family protein n=1 Tax=Thalassospira povalilytica TaxID=732237 RepID=UPI003AA8EB47
MQENIPPDFDWAGILRVNAPLLAFAVMVRLLWHQRLARIGQRRFWSWDLVWEAPMAVMCCVVGIGLASYLGLDGSQKVMVIGVCSWLGPRGGEVLLDKFLMRYAPSKGSEK